MNKDIYRVQKSPSYSLYTKNGANHRIHGPALSIGESQYFYIKGKRLTLSGHEDYVRSYLIHEDSYQMEKEYFEKALESSDGIFIHNLELAENVD
jgi:hypothetical protein